MFGTHFIGSAVLDLLFSRPMGRMQESEADYIGLMMMAEACYDPRQALGFWKRMERAQQEEPPEWLSTHPSVCAILFSHFLSLSLVSSEANSNQNFNRIQKIGEWIPKAIEKMEQSDCRGSSAFANLFRKAMERGVLIETL